MMNASSLIAHAIADPVVGPLFNFVPAVSRVEDLQLPNIQAERIIEGPDTGAQMEAARYIRNCRPGDLVVFIIVWKDGWARLIGRYKKDLHGPDSTFIRLMNLPTHLIRTPLATLHVYTTSSKYSRFCDELLVEDLVHLEASPLVVPSTKTGKIERVWVRLIGHAGDHVARAEVSGHQSARCSKPSLECTVGKEFLSHCHSVPRLHTLRNSRDAAVLVEKMLKGSQGEQQAARAAMLELGMNPDHISLYWQLPSFARDFYLLFVMDLLHILPLGVEKMILSAIPTRFGKQAAVQINNALLAIKESWLVPTELANIGAIYVNMDTTPKLRSIRGEDIILIFAFAEYLFSGIDCAEDLKPVWKSTLLLQKCLLRKRWSFPIHSLEYHPVRTDWIRSLRTAFGAFINLNRPNVVACTSVSFCSINLNPSCN